MIKRDTKHQKNKTSNDEKSFSGETVHRPSENFFLGLGELRWVVLNQFEVMDC